MGSSFPSSMGRRWGETAELGARVCSHIETLPTIIVGLLSEPWEGSPLPEFSAVELNLHGAE